MMGIPIEVRRRRYIQIPSGYSIMAIFSLIKIPVKTVFTCIKISVKTVFTCIKISVKTVFPCIMIHYKDESLKTQLHR